MKISKNIILYSFLVLVFAAFAITFGPFTAPIVVAAIFALGISYWLDNVFIKMNKKRKMLILSALSIALVVVLGAAVSASVRIYNVTLGTDRDETLNSLKQGKASLFENIDNLRLSLNKMGLNIQPITEDNIVKTWSTNFQSSLMNTTSKLGIFFNSFADFLLSASVFFIFLVLMVVYRKKLEAAIKNPDYFGGPKMWHVYRKSQFSSYASVLTIFSVGFIQTIAMTVGAAAVGFNESAIIFITTLVFSFFPVLGTAPMGLALSAIAFLQGDNKAGIIMVAIAMFVGVIDNLLKPYIVSQSGPQVHPLLALVGIVGAVVVFGVPGLFIGPFLMILVPQLKSEVRDLIKKPTETKLASVPYSQQEVNQ